MVSQFCQVGNPVLIHLFGLLISIIHLWQEQKVIEAVPELVQVPRAKMNGRLSIRLAHRREYIEKCADSLKETYVKKALTSEKVLLHLMDRVLPLERSAPQAASINITFQRFDGSQGQVIDAQVVADLPAPAELPITDAEWNEMKENVPVRVNAPPRRWARRQDRQAETVRACTWPAA